MTSTLAVILWVLVLVFSLLGLVLKDLRGYGGTLACALIALLFLLLRLR